jgi:hypothetical protein
LKPCKNYCLIQDPVILARYRRIYRNRRKNLRNSTIWSWITSSGNIAEYAHIAKNARIFLRFVLQITLFASWITTFSRLIAFGEVFNSKHFGNLLHSNSLIKKLEIVWHIPWGDSPYYTFVKISALCGYFLAQLAHSHIILHYVTTQGRDLNKIIIRIYMPWFWTPTRFSFFERKNLFLSPYRRMCQYRRECPISRNFGRYWAPCSKVYHIFL